MAKRSSSCARMAHGGRVAQLALLGGCVGCATVEWILVCHTGLRRRQPQMEHTMTNPHEIKTVKCAHCGKIRQEISHWFVAAVEEGKFWCSPLLPFSSTRSGNGLENPKQRLRNDEEPACGQQCAQKLFERYLSQRALHRQH